MTEVVLATLVMTAIVIALSLVVMGARKVLVPDVAVTVRLGDGREIAARAGDKLLPVLKDAGLPIPSACAGAGTCGLCKVRVEGAGEALPTEAARLGRAAIAAGERLACQVTLRGDVLADVPPEMLAAESFTGTVAEVRHLAPLMREIVFDLPADMDKPLEAGAFLQITAPAYDLSYSDIAVDDRFRATWEEMGLFRLHAGADEAVTRAYSVANRPQDAGRAVFNIRLALPPISAPDAPPGVVSSWLFGLKPGDRAELSGPFGDFRAQETEREMVFVGGGVGMAPLRAIVHDQLERVGTSRRMSFWYGARSRADLFYDEEFRALAAGHANFTWHVGLSDPAPGDEWSGPVGFIHDIVRREYLGEHPAPEECEYYLCGPPLMIRAVRAMLEDLGVEDDAIFFDDFGS